MRPRWVPKGPDAKPSDEAYQTEDTLRSENAADGLFAAQPSGTTRLWASCFVVPPPRLEGRESRRHLSSPEAQIRAVAASLAFRQNPNGTTSRAAERPT